MAEYCVFILSIFSYNSQRKVIHCNLTNLSNNKHPSFQQKLCQKIMCQFEWQMVMLNKSKLKRLQPTSCSIIYTLCSNPVQVTYLHEVAGHWQKPIRTTNPSMHSEQWIWEHGKTFGLWCISNCLEQNPQQFTIEFPDEASAIVMIFNHITECRLQNKF